MITTKKYIDKEKFVLKPFGDVHLGNKFADIIAFGEYLNDSTAYFLCLGDLFDSIIVKDKRYIKNADAYPGDDLINRAIEDSLALLSPIKERLLGICTGNHEEVYLKKANFDITALICKILNVEYLGYSFLMDIELPNGSLKVRGHHGWGGGSRTQGADLTKFSKDCQFWDADLFLYGHVHRLIFDKVPRLGTQDGRLYAREKYLVICGTFLKTFSDDTTVTYSESRGYPPVSIGAPIVQIDATGTYLDISVII